jgi:phosphoglycerate kinase
MAIPHSKLHEFDLRNKRVFLRADLNVPLNNRNIVDDFRLRAILPTIDLIRRKGGYILLATHLGRPKEYTPTLSTKILVPWFREQGYDVHFEPDIAAVSSDKNEHDIILLENLRFFPGEKNRDPAFAQKLFELGDYYVNDAFGLLHRDDTSVTLLPQIYAQDKKSFGLLVEEEFKVLSDLKDRPQEPFLVIAGGGKARDKLPFLRALLGKIDTLLLCPAIVFTFLQAQGLPVGKSLVDKESLQDVQDFMNEALKKGTRIVFPLDYQIARGSLEGPLEEVAFDSIPDDGVGISIGSTTEKLFAQELAKANTIFFNGLPGLWSRPETLNGARTLLELLGQSSAFTVIGGGDSVAAADRFGLASRISYCSTGGGATLAYLAGEALPGIVAMQ